MDYAHGFLGEPASVQVREHVLGCPDCREFLARLEEEVKLMREAARAVVPLSVGSMGKPPARMNVRSGPKVGPGRSENRSGRRIAMAAALLLCAGVSWMVLRSPSDLPVGGLAQARQEIEKLGSEKPAEREAAALKLKAMGRAAEPDLRKALSSTDPEVASRARQLLTRLDLVDELPESLRKAVPGIEDRLAAGQAHTWTQEFLNATELSSTGFPRNTALRKEDLPALITRAFRGAQNEEPRVAADRVVKWGLRLTQYLPAEEAIRCLHGSVDAENTPLQDLLGLILTKNGVSFVMDGAALKEGPQGAISMKVFDIPIASNLSLLLMPRRMDFATLGGVVVITSAGKLWKASATVPLTPEETAKLDKFLNILVSSDGAEEKQAYGELVTLGPSALGPLLGSLGHLDGKGARRVRTVCRKIAWDHGNLWLPDLPSGADLQKLSGAAKKLLETRIDCEARGMPLEDLAGLMGWKVKLKAKPQEPLSASVKGETLASFLKAATRPSGLDFYLDGETIVIDTEDNVCAAVER